jgi:predicted  nucleic acid-binding Zn-ribbon protein
MAMLNLVVRGKSFPVPKKCLFKLLEEHQELFEAKTYAVQSPVPLDIVETFVASLQTQSKISVTKENAASLSLLSSEFFRPELAAECAIFSGPVDPISSLSDRVCKLELQVSSFSNPPGKIEEEIESQERRVENLRLEVERQRESIEGKVARVASRVSAFSNQQRKIEQKIESQDRRLESLRSEVEKQRESFDRKLAVVVSRFDAIRSEFETLRGEVRAVKDSARGEIGQLKSETERVANSVSGLESLRPEFADLRVAVQRLQQDFGKVSGAKPGDSSEPGKAPATSKPVPPVRVPPTPKPFPSAKPPPASPTSHGPVAIPRKETEPLEGIISYLTKKYGGNVQKKGIVIITSKSIVQDDPRRAPENVADLTSISTFWSKDEPRQWVCWDFRDMRVCPTHYTITSWSLKSWVVEGSSSGGSWTVIDRQSNRHDFETDWKTASFPVATPAAFRFIRLTQTDKKTNGSDALPLRAVEFFGTLSE